MNPARKQVSDRVTLAEFVELRNYAAAKGITQDALVTRLVRAMLQRAKRRQSSGGQAGDSQT